MNFSHWLYRTQDAGHRLQSNVIPNHIFVLFSIFHTVNSWFAMTPLEGILAKPKLSLDDLIISEQRGWFLFGKGYFSVFRQFNSIHIRLLYDSVSVTTQKTTAPGQNQSHIRKILWIVTILQTFSLYKW